MRSDRNLTVLSQYGSNQDFYNVNEFYYCQYLLKKWKKNAQIEQWLDGIIVGYLLSVGFFFAFYFIVNRGLIPKESWNPQGVIIACAVIGVIFAMCYGIAKSFIKITNFTSGTSCGIERQDRQYYLWIELAHARIPIPIKKAKTKVYHPGCRILLFEINGRNKIRTIKIDK